MKFYAFEDIRRVGNCVEIANELFGVSPDSAGRCAAIWRGGDNPTSAHVAKEKWYDFVQKKGGGVVGLEAKRNGKMKPKTGE